MTATHSFLRMGLCILLVEMIDRWILSDLAGHAEDQKDANFGIKENNSSLQQII